MPVLVFILGILAAAGIWYYRAQAAQRTATDLLDAANDVRLAARRFGCRRKSNVHPVDSIDDARLAAAGIVHAVASMGAPLTQESERAINLQFQSVFGADKTEAAEISTFGAWIARQCGTKSEAVRRLGKRLHDLAGIDARQDLLRMIEAVVPQMGEDELDALRTLDRAFRV